MNQNIGYLTIILFIGTIIGLGLNPYVETPLNPSKEVTITSTETLPQITSTSSITLTSTSTLPKETTTNTITSTTSSIITSTTTIIGDDIWERFGMKIKEPQNILTYRCIDSDENDGSTNWRWSNYNRELGIIWYEAITPDFIETFEWMRNIDAVTNPHIIDRGQITIDNHIWEYETISYTDVVGGTQYMVNAVGFYPTKSMSYWIIFDSPNSDVLDEMKVYTDTFELLELEY